MKIGLQLTKNKNKYTYLLSVLKFHLNINHKLDFIFISDDNDLKHKIKSIDILITYGISDEIFMNASEKLKWIHIGSAGVEHTLTPSILKSKIIITNGKGIHAGPVSEFVMGMMLYLSKQYLGCEKFKISQNWTQWELARKTIQLKGKTIGIIGFGNIGKSIAKKANTFGMNVIATRRLQKKTEIKKNGDELIPISNLNYLLAQSDYVVISCPLTPLTKRMIGSNELKQMKSTAFIINIARGAIIDESALIHSLQQKQIAGAGLDVFEKEPIEKNNPLFKMNNVFLSPHISGNFPEYQHDIVIQFTYNLNRYFSGKALKNRVCKKRLY
jgi:phosphoglycerate dehydrogenase-like enzyme